MSLKPIKLYSHAGGPNPWKVAIILEELKVPYEAELMDFAVLHQKPFENINPNGRVPAIHDPNTNLTLWESGAIIEYLVETYDTTSSITYTTGPEKHQLRQWLHFQVSGQGPYYGQLAWFANFHAEKLESATQRYKDQTLRVLHVIDMFLSENDRTWLVGDKCTYADLAFVPWDQALPWLLGADEAAKLADQFPAWKRWHDALSARPAVAKVAADKKAASAH